jgi:hypothetical protein
MSSWQRTYVTQDVDCGAGRRRDKACSARRTSRLAIVDHSITMSWLS